MATKQQFAKCVGVRPNTNEKTGETREFYDFVLEDDPAQRIFSLGSYNNFKATLGQRFSSVLSVVPKACISRGGSPYINYVCVVTWEKI